MGAEKYASLCIVIDGKVKACLVTPDIKKTKANIEKVFESIVFGKCKKIVRDD